MPDLSQGAVFAGHRIEGVAGRGGMGTVYRATHLALDHVVALKVIAPDLVEDDSFRERFKSESRIAVSLRHPNVVPIHHAGEEDGLLFVTMDLIEGPDLRKLLIARGPLDGEHAIAILEQVASALDVAHSRGLVHRDIKPGNILIDEQAGPDRVFLTDFGLTKRMDQASGATALTSTGAFVGTLDYVAPEQIRGDDLDARTDVYALGCVLYEMLAGKAPFADREEKVAKMYAHLQDSPEPLAGEAAVFDDVIARAMAKNQDDRYPSAGDLARAAAAALEGTPVGTAERSVGVGPAAPTAAHATPVETVESPPPFASPQTAGATSPAETLAAPTAAVDKRTEAGPGASGRAPAAPRAAGGGRRAPLLIGGGVLAGIAVVAVILLGGGGGEDEGGGGSGATTASQGSGSASGGGAASFSPQVLDGGVPGGTLPVGVAADGDEVFIADRTGGQVLRGDAGSQQQTGSLGLDTPPEDLVVEGDSVFVTLPKLDQVLELDRELSGSNPFDLPSGSEPMGITAADGSIWVSGLSSGDVYRIDPATTEIETFDLDLAGPFGIAVTDDELWVVARDSDQVSRVDRESGEITDTITVGDNPKGVAVAAGAVYVANTDSGSVTVLNESDGSEIDTVPVGGQPRAIDLLGDHVWVSNGDEASLDLEQKEGWVSAFVAGGAELAEEKIVVGGSPEGLGVGGDRVWVATGPTRLARAIEP